MVNTYWVIVDLGMGRVMNKKIEIEGQTLEELGEMYRTAVAKRIAISFVENDNVTSVVPCEGTIVTVMTETKFNELKAMAERQRQQMTLIGLPPGFAPPRQ